MRKNANVMTSGLEFPNLPDRMTGQKRRGEMESFMLLKHRSEGSTRCYY